MTFDTKYVKRSTNIPAPTEIMYFFIYKNNGKFNTK